MRRSTGWRSGSARRAATSGWRRGSPARAPEARVTGAYATHGRQHIDFDTTQEHAAPNTTSDLAFRGVLTGRSTAVWKGNIIVDPGAQKTDAFQESRNLLLSKRAHADAIPGLEIQANDVRCTHAAAVAQLDPEQLFYLRSRGLPLEVAKRLVIEGFLAALVERFEEGPVRERAERRARAPARADPGRLAARRSGQRRELVERLELVVLELELRRPRGSPRSAAIELVPGIGRMTGECWSSHASATWRGVAPWPRAISVDGASRGGRASLPLAIGAQGRNASRLPRALLQHVLGRSVDDVVAVLDGDDRDDLLGALEVLESDVGQADVADLALLLELGQRADRVLDRHLRVDRVQLVEVDPLEPQPLERRLAAAARRSGRQFRSHTPGPGRSSPPLVAITRFSG